MISIETGGAVSPYYSKVELARFSFGQGGRLNAINGPGSKGAEYLYTPPPIKISSFAGATCFRDCSDKSKAVFRSHAAVKSFAADSLINFPSLRDRAAILKTLLKIWRRPIHFLLD
jgi:hypothetical protein